MKRLYKILPISIIVTFILIFFIVSYINPKIPRKPQAPQLTYNNESIECKLGEYNWFDESKGGNTVFAESDEIIAKNITQTEVKRGEDIKFHYKYKPQNVVVSIKYPDKTEKYRTYNSGEDGMVVMPDQPGVYIFIITASWDTSHNTDHIFKIKVV